MCGIVHRASDGTECGYLIILHSKTIVILSGFLKFFLLYPVFGVLIGVQKL